MKAALIVTYDPPPTPGWEGLCWHASLSDYDEGDPYAHAGSPREAVRQLAELRRQRAEIRLSRTTPGWTLSDLRRHLCRSK